MIRKPYLEKMELLKNLGARRAMLNEQKIQPLMEEFETETTEHSVLTDLKITTLFKSFVEYFNEYMDTSEEVYNQLVYIIDQMIKINDEEYVPRSEYEKLQQVYEQALAATGQPNPEEEEEAINHPTRSGGPTLGQEDLLREQFAKKVARLIRSSLAEGKQINKMKKVFRDRLKVIHRWQGRMVDEMIDDATEAIKVTGKLPEDGLDGEESENIRQSNGKEEEEYSDDESDEEGGEA